MQIVLGNGNADARRSRRTPIDPPPAGKPPKLRFPAFFNPPQRTPVMMEFAARIEKQARGVFASMDVFGVIHLEDNALAFVGSLIRLGLNPKRATFFAKGIGYRYANKNGVIGVLRRWGVSVHSTEDITARWFDKVAKRAMERKSRLFFIEDGPFFGPLLLAQPAIWEQVTYIQQTTRGMNPFETFEGKIGFPVLSLPESELKKLKEPIYVGKTFMRGLSTLFPHREWANQKIAIFGSGAIGRAVGDAASALCMRPAFVDTNPRSRFLADNLCGELTDAIDAVRGAAVIAGFTGGAKGPSITADVLAAADHGAIVITGSSEQFEIELPYLNTAGAAKPYYIDGIRRSPRTRVATRYTIGPLRKEIILVNDGWPMSFIGLPGTTLPDQLADFVMTLMLVGSVELAAGRFTRTTGVIPGAIDKLADEHGIPATYLRYWRS